MGAFAIGATKAFEKKKRDFRSKLDDLTQTRRVTYKTIRLIVATLLDRQLALKF
jgi:hypothetical protein